MICDKVAAYNLHTRGKNFPGIFFNGHRHLEQLNTPQLLGSLPPNGRIIAGLPAKANA